MAGTSLAAHLRRLAVVLGIAALIALALVVHGWPSSRQAAAAGDSDVLVDSGGFGGFSSIVLDVSGSPVVSYYDAANNNVKVVHCGNSDCSSGNAIVIVDNTATLFQSAPNLRLDPTGHPVIAYYDIATNLLNVLHCGDANCSAGNSIATPEVVNAGVSTSLAVDVLSHPVITYIGADNHLKVLHCGNAACTTGNVIATPDPTSIQQTTALALDATGNPIVAYRDRTYNTLKVLYCGNPTCLAGNTITSIDSKARVSRYLALVLDPAGDPVVNYRDGVTNKLKLLHCGNLTCTSGNTITTLDAWGYSGMFTPSLAIDAAGNAAITWLDTFGPPGTLILRCGNPSCVSGNTYGRPSSYGQFPAMTLDASGLPVISLIGNGLRMLHCGNPTCKAQFSTPTPTKTLTGTPPPTATPPGRPNFSIGIDTNGDADDDCRTDGQGPSKCTLTLNSTFRVRVYLHSFSGFSSYDSFDLFLTYFGVNSQDDASTAAWPDCGYPATFYKPSLVSWGCALGLGASPSAYTGLIGTNDFTCTASGGIVMTHGYEQTTLSEHAKDPRFESDGTESLTINCLAATPTHTATPTRTPRSMPLGGVADYPNVDAGGGAPLLLTGLAAAATGLLALGGAARYARSRFALA